VEKRIAGVAVMRDC